MSKQLHHMRNWHDLGFCDGEGCALAASCRLLAKARRPTLTARTAHKRKPTLAATVGDTGSILIQCKSFKPTSGKEAKRG